VANRGACLTDDQLISLVARGEEEACRILVQRWERPVFAFLYRMTGSREEAQELGQETFLRMYQGASRYKPSGQFRSWLFRIAGNQARSLLRRRRIVQWMRFDLGTHERPRLDPGADEMLERDETMMAVRAAIARLPERQRQALLLRQYEELNYEQIAKVMQTSVSAVESLLHRASLALRIALGEQGILK
jgi:RNA polymerase sigma-70 factor, ECF subfamily